MSTGIPNLNLGPIPKPVNPTAPSADPSRDRYLAMVQADMKDNNQLDASIFGSVSPTGIQQQTAFNGQTLGNANNTAFQGAQDTNALMMQMLQMMMQMLTLMMGLMSRTQNQPVNLNLNPTSNALPERISLPSLDNLQFNGFSNTQPTAPEKPGNTTSGEKLADIGEQVARRMNTRGRCYAGVTQALGKMGIKVGGMSAYMAAGQLEKNPKVQEVKGLSANDLKSLPAGAVVVWPKGPRSPHGHVSIALGDGREASDHVANQITNYRGVTTGFRVFMPVA